ncbi:MAG: ankyrin repeat domain-containing protein [Thermoflexales bacterium]
MPMTSDTPLQAAARDGELNAINEFLAQSAAIDARGEYGDTALNLAAENGHTEVVARLIEAGANIENVGGADKTPLMCATFAGHTKIVQMLLSKGAQINRDLLSSLQLKVSILEENAEDGMVNPAAAEAWQRFLDFMIEAWNKQNTPAPPGNSV